MDFFCTFKYCDSRSFHLLNLCLATLLFLRIALCLISFTNFFHMRKLLLLMLLLASMSHLWAQRQVSGTVTTGGDGSPLSGVSVIAVGTTTGAFTDSEGKFSIDCGSATAIQFSYIGYETKEVEIGSQSVVNVSLNEIDVNLDDVVITAMGLERSKKALSYSVTEVGGESFVEAREVNLANALTGKIAGVNASNLSTGPAGSSRVVIRGAVSLTGDNQPLYIVDGIPIDNSTFGQAGLWGGVDEGDGMSSINPDDIETISVLKGANAAALYGSRASNGVILITTKSGKGRKGVGVELSSNLVFETPINFFDFQDQYGHGRDGLKPIDAQDAWNIGNGSNWGGKLDGSNVPQFDGVSRPYSFQAAENMKRFYRTGSTWTNTVGLSGGNQDHAVRLNASILDNKSIQPNAGYKRRNITTSYTGKFGKLLTITSKVLYSNEDAQNRPRIADSPGNSLNALFSLPVNYNVDDLRGDPNKPGAIPEGFDPVDDKATGEEMQISNNLWNANPWWAAYQFDNDDQRDRVITSQVAKIDITDFLYVQGRVGMDWYVRRETDVTPYGTGYSRLGGINERERRSREINMEALLGFDETFGDISVNAFVAGNQMRRKFEGLFLNGGNFIDPNIVAVKNTANQTFDYEFSQEGINSVYGSATIGYKDYLYLSGSARQDWFSTLDIATNSILYPSVGGSLVFSEMLGISNDAFNFGKLRASWAQVGGDTDPYNLDLTYGLGNGHLDQPDAFIVQSTIPNRALVPLTSTEFEVGVDLRFFQNRLGVDLTYYSQRTTNDILDASISATSGFGSTRINIGEMTNKGLELLLTGSIIQKKDFKWDISYNMAMNNNEVVFLNEGIDEIGLADNLGIPRTRWAFAFNIVGEPFGTIKGFEQATTESGELIFDSNGFPVQSSEAVILGNGVHRFTGGITNSFNFKGIYADFLIDFKTGGQLYSGSNVRMVGYGAHRMTVEPVSGPGFVSEGREKITVTGVDENGDALNVVLGPDQTDGFWGAYSQLSDRFIYDASFAKLRQISVGYSIPRSLIDNTPIQSLRVSFVGRNLALLYTQLENVDPESVHNNSNAQGLEYFSFPQTRTYGFNLKIDF